jgi:alpha-L-rhamnosidase
LTAPDGGGVKAPEGTFWIGPSHPFDLADAYLDFRADLDLDVVPPQVVLHISADSRYRLWINGHFVGRGPERSWPSVMAVDSRSIAGLLRPGRNRIAVQVHSPGHSHFSYIHRGACGLICWLDSPDRTLLGSDTGWRCRRNPSWAAPAARVSIYGTGVEQRDMAEDDAWQDSAVDWPAARIVQPPEGPVWASLRPRATPLPVEDCRALTSPWQTRLGPTPADTDDPHEDLRVALAACPPAPLSETLPPGQTAIWIFDLGESRACLGLATLTVRAGDRLSVSYAERLRDGEILLSDPATYCRMRPTDRFTLRDGRQTAEGFTPRGARYLIFRLDSGGGTPAPEFHARLPRYPLTEHPLPAMGDPALDAIAQMCRRTTVNCLQDGFVDGVWRESSLWLGDAVAQSFALRAISNDPRPHLFALEMAAEGAAADGILPSVLPGDVPAYVITDYNFSWIELLHACLDHPGIPDAHPILARHWPTLTRLMARFDQDRGPDGLIRSQPGRRLFLDWSAQSRQEPNLTYNLRHLHALRLAADIARRLGHHASFAAQAAALAATLRTTHLTEDWRESPGGAPACQLALALLILTDTVTGAEADTLADRIETDTPTPASPFMHHYVFQALACLGRGPAIRRLIARRWGPWAVAGEPTTWENWSIDFPDGSACHGFSAHPLGWLLRDT